MAAITGAAVKALTRYAAVFEAADPPRAGTVAFWKPAGADSAPRRPAEGGGPAGEADPAEQEDGDGLPDLIGLREIAHLHGLIGELTVVVPHRDGVVRRSVPALRLPVRDAVPVLTAARRASGAVTAGASGARSGGGPSGAAHPAAAFWGAAALIALQLVARGRIVPGLSPRDFDAWRVGPLDAADIGRIRELADAMPAEARAVPLPGGVEPRLPDAEGLTRSFVEAVADGMPRTAAAVRAAGAPAFAAVEPQHVPRLRGWADDVAAGWDTGVRISLRMEVSGGPDGLEHPGREGSFRAVVQVHSLADPTSVADAAALWGGDGHRFGERARVDAAVAVRRAARVWAPMGRLLEQPVPDEMAVTDAEVTDLLGGACERLAAAGVDVHWPKELLADLTAQAVVGHDDAPPSDVPAFFGGDTVLRFDWRLALGGTPLTGAELDRLAEAQRPVVRLRDRWTLVAPDLLRKARERELKPLTPVEALGAALTGTARVGDETVPVAAGGWLDRLRERIADPDGGHEPLEPPPGLAASLRDYQLRGLRWLDRMTSLGLGGCLADDMGLGKTITLIALHLRRQTEPATQGPTLVVCPASLLGNWQREIGRFAPGTAVRRYHGTGRSLEGAREGFVLTTYGTMRMDAAVLAGHGWGLVVADEAQHAKNPRSRTAKALRRIRGGARVALTGTPVENNLSELWAVLDWTTPGLLGTLGGFRSRWAKAVEGGDEKAAAQLAGLIRPFLLRRRKSDPGIAPELPAKTETDQAVSLTVEQAALYEAVVREAMEEIRGSSGMARRGLVVKLLTACKQICNHPAQYVKEPRPVLAGRSGKLELLDELLDTILAEGGAVLVFTQYVAMARLLECHLRDRGVESLLLHGGTPVARREEMVRAFQDGGVPVFLLSLKAAGTGLNLTRADHVIHYDRWWNPAVEEQATDRAYRIGQSRPVQVHRLVTEGTVEDRIAGMLRAKRRLADAVLSGGEGALTELSDAELADLVSLRGTR